MTQRSAMIRAPKPWKCAQCGWLLGFVVVDTAHVRRLNVLRIARDLESDLVRIQMHLGQLADLAYYSAMGVNSCENVPCCHCGAHNRWDMGDDALAELLERRGLRAYGLEGA